MINRNMRCIEIDYVAFVTQETSGINRNMRCIEIFFMKKRLNILLTD